MGDTHLKKDEEKDKEPNREKQWWNKPDHELIKDRVSHLKGIYNDAKIDVEEDERSSLYEEMKERNPGVLNLLDMTIKKTDDFVRKDEDLLVPVYSSKKGEKIASLLKLKTERKIRLDEYGWAVWDLIDTSDDVREIGIGLKERFGDKVEPLYPRLSKFLAYLVKLELVTIEKKK
jgi:hypothetical protein